MHVALGQAFGWIATFGGAWAIMRAGAAKGAFKLRAPVRCAACGRQKAWGRCPCTDRPSSLR
jgi:hypothetical protein